MVLVCTFAVLLAQSPNLGKTHAQILAMGLEKWVDFASAKNGESTAAMSGTLSVYADAAGNRNDRLVRGLPKAKQPGWRGVLKDMRDYETRVSEVGPYLTGGGTMWIVLAGSASAEMEDAFYNAVSRKGPKPPPMRVSDASKALDKLEAMVRKGQDWEFMTHFRKPDALKSVADARFAFGKIVKFASNQDRRTSDVLLDFCRDQARSVASAAE